MNVMHYNGYSARVDFDAEDGIFVGHLAGINDIVGFHAETVRDLVIEFHQAVDDYIMTCQSIGKITETSYTGTMMLQVRPEVHASTVLAAQLAGKSLDQWSEEVLERAASVAGVTR